MTKPRIVGEYLHRETMRLVSEGQGDYWTCHHMVLDSDPGLKLLYAGLAGEVRGPAIPPKPKAEQSESHTAGAELHDLTVKFMHQMNFGPDKYKWSLRQILKSNPGLTKKYQT